MKLILIILLMSVSATCFAQRCDYNFTLPAISVTEERLNEVLTNSYTEYKVDKIIQTYYIITRDKMLNNYVIETKCYDWFCGELLNRICPTKDNYKEFLKVIRDKKDWEECRK